jgi:Zn-dependent protease
MTGVAFALLALPMQAAGALAPAFRDALAMLIFLQATALILNLLPVPGLDGFGVFEPFLPGGLRAAVTRLGGLAIMTLFVVLLLVPGAAQPLFDVAFALVGAFHVRPEWVIDGLTAFRFWER